MNRIILLVTITFVTLIGLSQSKSKADKDTQNWRYETEAVATGEGSYIFKVWSYSKKPVVAIEQAKKNAVHAVVFRGIEGNSNGISKKKPIASNPNLEQDQKDFFDNFFADGGKYMKFVSISNDGSVAAEDRLKVGKEYKIGVVVSVNVNELRKDLETAGIIRGLNSGF